MPTGNLYDTIVKRDPLTKGWSEDKKYCITTSDGTDYLLRIAPADRYETKKLVFSTMEQIAAQGIPMCLPVEFGICDEGVYTIQSWIDGIDLEELLPLSSKTTLPVAEQYALGLQAGKLIKKIHTIPIPEPPDDWAVNFGREIDWAVQEYRGCGLHFAGDDEMVAYLERYRPLLKNRPQSLLVGDYNVLNMMYAQEGLKIIDFERYCTGDPWNEFNCIVWSAMASPHFATGQIHGYFDGEPPEDFFYLLGVYTVILVLSLTSSWAVSSEFGRKVTLNLSQDVLRWYDHMQNPVPVWYLGERYHTGAEK